MNNYKSVFYIIIIFSLSSCYSKIRLRIDSFNSNEFAQSNIYKNYKYKLLLTNLSEFNINNFEKNIDSRISNIRNTIKENFDNTDSEIDVLMAPIIELKNSLPFMSYDFTIKYLALYENSNFSKDLDLAFNYLESEYNYNYSIYNEFNTYLDEYTDGIPAFRGFQVLDNSIKMEIPKLKNEGVFGNIIYGDDMANFVVSAPDDYWKKYNNITTLYGSKSNKDSRINEVKVVTFLGNSDIAIKMDTIGVFTIKGIRNDNREAQKMAGKMLEMGIKYIALTQGVSGDMSNSMNISNSGDNLELMNNLLKTRINSLALEHDIKKKFLIEELNRILLTADSDVIKKEKIKLILESFIKP